MVYHEIKGSQNRSHLAPHAILMVPLWTQLISHGVGSTMDS
jgi:hypothetical protein